MCHLICHSCNVFRACLAFLAHFLPQTKRVSDDESVTSSTETFSPIVPRPLESSTEVGTFWGGGTMAQELNLNVLSTPGTFPVSQEN